MQDALSFYESEASGSLSEAISSEKLERRIAIGRLVIAIAGIVILYLAFNGGGWPAWVAALICVAAFISLVRLALRQEQTTKRARTRLGIANAELQSLRGDNSAFYSGDAYVDVSHPFSYDLDIFGKSSLFQMLARTVTLNGTALLADRLREPEPVAERVRARQDAIRELSANPELLMQFRVTGNLSTEAPGELALLLDWQRAADEFRSQALIRTAALVMPLLAACGIALSAWEERMHPALNLILLVNGFLWASQLKRIKEQNRQLGRNAAIVAKYSGLLAIMGSGAPASDALRKIAAGAKAALPALLQFNRLVERFDSRNNGMAGPLMNLLFLHDFRSLLRLEAWRNNHRDLMRQVVTDLAEYDLLNALGCYAFNHQEHSYPDLNEAAPVLEATDLRHPLLDNAAVGNSFSIGATERLYLLTGANMTGKSTFIRTVGAALVLGYLGLPLPAAQLSIPLLRIFTSIRVTDSVQEDISYFKAELSRIRRLFDTVREGAGRYLVLIDEPLRGTNSADKQEGSEAIIRRLLAEGVIGIVATHDTGLCRLESSTGGSVRNVHFESRIEAGSLHFDFRLKAGCSQSANASLLMRQMGIIA